MKPSGIHVVARALCRPEKTDELCGILLRVAEESRKEPGCVSYEVVRGTEDPNEVMTIECWKDKEAIDAHFARPYVVDLFARVPGLVAQTPEVKTYLPA
jgi:quinol monooxygenase YgiN